MILCLTGTRVIFSAACEGGFGRTVGEDQGTASTACRTHIYLFARLFLQAIEPSRDFTERMKFCGQSDHALDAFENSLRYWYYYY